MPAADPVVLRELGSRRGQRTTVRRGRSPVGGGAPLVVTNQGSQLTTPSGRRVTDRRADNLATPEPSAAGVADVSARPRWWRRAWSAVQHRVVRTVRWFRETDPTFMAAFTPALLVAALLYVRSPASNYIFDEQEALLANPYVNGQGLGFWDAFHRDFWGLPPTRSIGSYRPIPDLIWRALWTLSDRPWLHHWVNVVFHAVNAALISSLTLAISRQRKLAWLSGAAFLLAAVLTEAVTGVVGIADVLVRVFLFRG